MRHTTAGSILDIVPTFILDLIVKNFRVGLASARFRCQHFVQHPLATILASSAECAPLALVEAPVFPRYSPEPSRKASEPPASPGSGIETLRLSLSSLGRELRLVESRAPRAGGCAAAAKRLTANPPWELRLAQDKYMGGCQNSGPLWGP